MGMVIFLGILELIILIMTVTYFIGLLKAIKLTFTGVKCDVEICDLWAKRKGRGRRSRHYVSFRIEGILIVQIISYFRFLKLKKGDMIHVRYLKNKPKVARANFYIK